MKLLKNRVFLASIFFTLVVLFVTVQAVRSYQSRARVEQLKKEGLEMSKSVSLVDMAKMMKAGEASPEAKAFREKQKEFRDKVQALPESERGEVMRDQMKQGMGLAKVFLGLPKGMQNFVLDSFIDRMEADRKKWEQRAKDNAVSGGNGGNGGEGRRPRGPVTDEQRDKFTKKFLDATTAEERATMTEGMRMMNDRRRERGLPPISVGNMGRRRPGQ